jgi:peptidoglycan-N-acetylglucosamine deacetylase
VEITLSFDNGPEPDVTPAVLDVLARRNVKASFFVIGRKLEDPARRALAARAHAEGHWIGNHTYTHTTPLGLSAEPDVAEAEIGRTQRAMGKLAHPDRLFRPFGGGGNLDRRLLNQAVVDYLVHGGYTVVLWSAIPRDWEAPEDWIERALGQCRASAWTLLVLHDLPTGAMRHLDRFIGAAGDAGARFRREFPPDCVPIVRGDIVKPVEPYTAEPAGAAAPR